MKEATYKLRNGDEITVQYDENASCKLCGLPVTFASTSGTNVCCWCDCGKCRFCSEQLPWPVQKAQKHIKYCQEIKIKGRRESFGE